MIRVMRAGFVAAVLALAVSGGVWAETISLMLFDADPIDPPASPDVQYQVVNGVAGADQPFMYRPYPTHGSLQTTGTGPFGETGLLQTADAQGASVAFYHASAVDWTKLQQWTVELWVNPAAKDSPVDPINYNGVNPRLTYHESANGFLLEVNVYDGDAWRTGPRGSRSIPLNTWTHIAIVFDGDADEIRTYVNGEPDTAMTYAAETVSTGNAIVIGGFGNFQTNVFRGSIDEIRVSDQALPPGEGTGVGELAFKASLAPKLEGH